jgi:hypothetical protein
VTGNRTILIAGVTGAQGGAVAPAPQGAGFHLRGLTRKPDSEGAATIQSAGAGCRYTAGVRENRTDLKR